MKKSKVLEYLAGYKDDEELLIAWWDKETVEEHNDTQLTDDEWVEIVRAVDDIDHALESATDAIADAVQEIKGEN
jgi:hypothetical protein